MHSKAENKAAIKSERSSKAKTRVERQVEDDDEFVADEAAQESSVCHVPVQEVSIDQTQDDDDDFIVDDEEDEEDDASARVKRSKAGKDSTWRPGGRSAGSAPVKSTKPSASPRKPAATTASSPSLRGKVKKQESVKTRLLKKLDMMRRHR